MTKKQMKELNNQKRGTWFGVNPLTKIVEDKKKKRNKKACRGKVVY